MNECTMKRGIFLTNYLHMIEMGRKTKTFFFSLRKKRQCNRS